MVIVWLVLTLVVVAMGYIRLAPSDPVEWHQMPDQPQVEDFANGVIRVVETGPNGLAELDAIATATPHTERRFGSVEDGMVTYVTRSLVFGFPDYTTVRQTGDTLEIYGRARFGKSDLGVNRARVEGWIDALQPR
ncbi:DUF1499 domain-containing protein [Sedimentitalea sp.]|uniref:DUF1499 domain-containing protein n=1 Tax=Sedimentitalea sp. TaxID=2048915 RepID=UPI003299D15F